MSQIQLPLLSNFTEKDEELESAPKSWENMIHNVENIIDIEVKEPIETKRKSFVSHSFSGQLSSKKHTDGPNLPAYSIVVDAWKEVEKPLPKMSLSKLTIDICIYVAR